MNRTETAVDRQSIGLRAAPGAGHRPTIDLARVAGTKIVGRSISPRALIAFGDVELLLGMPAARQIELAARHAARDYMRQARGAGRRGHQVEQAFGLTPGVDSDRAAYPFSAGSSNTVSAPRNGRSSGPICRSGNHVVSHRSLVNGLADDEHRLVEGRGCLGAPAARLDIEWEARR